MHLKTQPLLKCKMNQEYFRDKDFNGAGTESEGPSSGRCSVAKQRRPGRQPVTAEKLRRKWSKEINVIIMECYFQRKPTDENGVPIRGYRQRMYRAWQERGIFPSREQRITVQARAIRKKRVVDGYGTGRDKQKSIK